MKSIRDPRLRRTAAAAALCRGSAAGVIAEVAALLSRGGRSQPAVSAALGALILAVDEDALLPYQRRAELYRCAREEGAEDIARLFLQAEPRDAAIDEDALTPTRALRPQGRLLTLGERKHMARTRDPALLMHLLRDPHPEVTRILLDNPHLRETDVLVLASNRPAHAQALRAIARHPRWSLRPRLRYALSVNPYAPLPLCFRLAVDLPNRRLQEISTSAALSPQLRLHARELLLRRGLADETPW